MLAEAALWVDEHAEALQWRQSPLRAGGEARPHRRAELCADAGVGGPDAADAVREEDHRVLRGAVHQGSTLQACQHSLPM